jgi:hypothetical protein
VAVCDDLMGAWTALTDDRDERHQNRDTRGEIRSLVNIAPNGLVGVELGETERSPIASRRNDDQNDRQSDDIERRSSTVHPSDPPGRERGHDTVNQHQEDREQKDLQSTSAQLLPPPPNPSRQRNTSYLIIRRNIARILNTRRRKNHSRNPIIHTRRSRDLTQPIRPPSHPSSQRTPTRRRQNSSRIVQPAARGHGRAELRHRRSDRLDADHGHQPAPGHARGPGVAHAIVQCRGERGQ